MLDGFFFNSNYRQLPSNYQKLLFMEIAGKFMDIAVQKII